MKSQPTPDPSREGNPNTNDLTSDNLLIPNPRLRGTKTLPEKANGGSLMFPLPGEASGGSLMFPSLERQVVVL